MPSAVTGQLIRNAIAIQGPGYMQAISPLAENTPSPNIDEAQLLSPGTPHVAILMCTYNGETLLSSQLKSFESQSHPNWSLHVSDDGSTDHTLALLQQHLSTWKRNSWRIVSGPREGFARNFLSLTCRQDIDADYFAWSDQDDIWSPEKLEIAIKWLKNIPDDVPALYCGRTQIVCEQGISRGLSPMFPFPPHFRNALVQSIAGGNTMLFNRAARALLIEAGEHLTIPSHDWWCYQLVTSAGGIVHYDPQPMLLYRQHGNNIIGSNFDWRARTSRLFLLFQGQFYKWNDQNIYALESMSHRMSSDSCRTFTLFKKARNQILPARLITMARAGLYRQTFFGNLGLLLATLLKKI